MVCTARRQAGSTGRVPDPSEVFQTRRGGAMDPHTRLPGYTCSTMLGVTQVIDGSHQARTDAAPNSFKGACASLYNTSCTHAVTAAPTASNSILHVSVTQQVPQVQSTTATACMMMFFWVSAERVVGDAETPTCSLKSRESRGTTTEGHTHCCCCC